MFRRALLLVLAAAAASACGVVESAEESFELTRPVDGRVRVEIHNDDGDTCIVRGREGEVRVHGLVVARGVTASAAERLAETIVDDPPVVFDGRTVRIERVREWVESHRRPGRRWARDWFDHDDDDSRGHSTRWGLGATVEWVVEVPFDTEVELETRSGHGCVEGIVGPVVARTASGGMDVLGIGAGVTVHSGTGNVRITGALSVEARSLSGDLRIVGVEENVTADTVSGDIELEEIRGSLTAHSAGGRIAVDSELFRDASWTVRTASGDVDVRLPRDASFALEARSERGKVDTGFVLDARTDTRSELVGSVGTRPTGAILVETASGDVRIDPRTD